MLSQVLSHLQQRSGAFDEETLCRQLGISPQMLDHMLDTLIRLGKLQPVEPPTPAGCTQCRDCPIANCTPALEYKESRFRVAS